jgi:autotransporter-associated beta strand protein
VTFSSHSDPRFNKQRGCRTLLGGGTVSITKVGGGTLTLSGTNTYTGTTNVNDGVLTLQGFGGGGTTYNGGILSINGLSTLRVTGSRYNFSGKTFTFDSVGGGTIDAIASGAGGLVFTGGNSFTTTGGAQNTISGTRIAAENQGVNLNGHTATFDVATGTDPTSDLKVTGTLWNGGGVVKNGTGRMEISAAQQYTGTTTVNEGTLILGDGTNNVGLSNSHDVVIASGATLQLNYPVGSPDSIDELSLGGVLQSPGIYGAGTYSGVTITGTGTLNVLSGPIADPFLAWIDSFFPGEADPLIIGAAADPDNDGIENLAEYVLKNGDPAASFTGILPTLDATGANFVFTYLRRAAATGTAQTFQYGSDLIGWTDVTVTDGGIVSITSPEDGIQQIVITVAKGTNTKLFGRLQVVK